MTSQLVALCIGAHDPGRLARFWAGVLGWDLTEVDGGPALRPRDDAGLPLRFLATDAPKAGPNQMHFDLTSTSLEDQRQTVARVLELGGRHLDIGQGPEARHVVLADPEGNEFCVIEPGNGFLAGCGVVGALSSDGTEGVGHFWSAALGWPLVWDQDEETAIQSPHGGSKISWGGPPVRPKTTRNRMHLHLAPPATDDPEGELEREVERLVGLGARRSERGPGEPAGIALLDPDGNEFCLVTTE